MEKKRYYRRPTSKLIPLDTTEILAGSTSIPGGTPGGSDTPTPGEGGFIWVESKRQGDRIIDDDEDW